MFEAGPLAPEDFVDAFAWVGAPEEVAAKITCIAPHRVAGLSR